MSKKLANKVAIVTGASKGIGAAIALNLAENGAAVVVNYSTSKEGADRIVGEIVAAGGKAVAIQANVSKESDIQRLVSKAMEAFGSLDILINNAGIYGATPLETITAEQFHNLFDLNVLGLLLMSQQAAKHFKPSGGSIINISSVASVAPLPGWSVYSATKGAVDAITKSLAKELGPHKIRVNSINPGMVDTEGVRSLGISESDFRQQVESTTPLGRIGQPQDIAPAVSFLVSDDAAWITGETFVISGGLR